MSGSSEAPAKKRANFIRAPHFFNLNMACRALAEAFDNHIYLVGSSLERRDYGDVDVRCILPDDDFDRLFPNLCGSPSRDPLWSLMCSSISLYLSQHSDLPVDFQIQRMTEANAEFEGPRHALGIFYMPKPRSP